MFLTVNELYGFKFYRVPAIKKKERRIVWSQYPTSCQIDFLVLRTMAVKFALYVLPQTSKQYIKCGTMRELYKINKQQHFWLVLSLLGRSLKPLLF